MEFLNRKIDGIIIILFSVIYALLTLQVEDGVVSETHVSAQVFPFIIAGILFLSGAILALKNEGADHLTVWPRGVFWKKIMIFTLIMLVYAYTIDTLGFFLGTSIIAFYVARTLGGKLLPSVLASFSICFFIQILFDVVLEVSLPLGDLLEPVVHSIFPE